MTKKEELIELRKMLHVLRNMPTSTINSYIALTNASILLDVYKKNVIKDDKKNKKRFEELLFFIYGSSKLIPFSHEEIVAYLPSYFNKVTKRKGFSSFPTLERSNVDGTLFINGHGEYDRIEEDYLTYDRQLLLVDITNEIESNPLNKVYNIDVLNKYYNSLQLSRLFLNTDGIYDKSTPPITRYIDDEFQLLTHWGLNKKNYTEKELFEKELLKYLLIRYADVPDIIQDEVVDETRRLKYYNNR